MKKLGPVLGLALLACPLFAGAAAAQAVEGQSFYATPMSPGGYRPAMTQVQSPAAEAPPPPPAPAPVVAPKHRVKHKKM